MNGTRDRSFLNAQCQVHLLLSCKFWSVGERVKEC